jgi:hypothetical protein
LKAQARQIAEINPDIVDGISSDAIHVIHDAQHDLPTLLFVTSRSYIATYPNVIIGSGTAKELELSPFLRQTVKAQNSLNGENLSHGIVA